MNICQPSPQQDEGGFTLVEAIIGLMILVLAASVILFSLLQINRMASVARLYTAARMIVQSNIDTIQSDAPFLPQNYTPETSAPPTELAVGTTSSNNVAIYVDPATNNTLVSGTLTTVVTDLSNSSLDEYGRMATVYLNYTYRNKLYQVVESTVRGSDE